MSSAQDEIATMTAHARALASIPVVYGDDHFPSPDEVDLPRKMVPFPVSVARWPAARGMTVNVDAFLMFYLVFCGLVEDRLICLRLLHLLRQVKLLNQVRSFCHLIPGASCLCCCFVCLTWLGISVLLNRRSDTHRNILANDQIAQAPCILCIGERCGHRQCAQYQRAPCSRTFSCTVR